MSTHARKRRSVQVGGVESVFCLQCGHFIGKLKPSQKRILAAMLNIENDWKYYRKTIRLRHSELEYPYVARSSQLMDRTSLHENVIYEEIRKLRDLGFIDGRKEYGRGYNVYRLSKKTRNDVLLMEQITLWSEHAVLKPATTLTVAELAAGMPEE